MLPAAQTYCTLELEKAKHHFVKQFGGSSDSYKEDASDRIRDMQLSLKDTLASWEVVIIDSPEPNAWVSPFLPCRVFVCRGLLEKLSPSDDELAMILGHEIARLILRHPTKQQEIRSAQSILQLLLLVLHGSITWRQVFSDILVWAAFE